MKKNIKKTLLISSSFSALALSIVSASCIHKLSPSILLAKEFLKTNPVSKDDNKKKHRLTYYPLKRISF